MNTPYHVNNIILSHDRCQIDCSVQAYIYLNQAPADGLDNGQFIDCYTVYYVTLYYIMNLAIDKGTQSVHFSERLSIVSSTNFVHAIYILSIKLLLYSRYSYLSMCNKLYERSPSLGAAVGGK